ncbi:hydroxycarboxylic acid receptor 3-like [Pelobates fuscus]|uniref:hydroxycarboxylic acid receptor 3-like n=1 Tax=Pelobates fuscus TaxID=191477 RepID=UPI002FE44BBE
MEQTSQEEDDSFNLLSSSTIDTDIAFFLASIYGVVFLLGLLANTLLLWAIWPQVKNKESIASYVVNLICAALLESVTLPFGIAYLIYSLQLPSVACSFVYVVPTISQRIGATFVVLIFVIRYVAVNRPLKYHKFCSRWVCSFVSIFLWLIIISISIIERLIAPYNANLCFPDFKVAPQSALFDLIFSLIFGLLPLILLVIFWYLISRALNNSPSVPTGQRRRISILLLLVVIGFFVLYGPLTGVRVYLSILLLLNYTQYQVTVDLILIYQLMFALNSLCIGFAPLFYFFSSSGVKERITGLFRKNQKSSTPR